MHQNSRQNTESNAVPTTADVLQTLHHASEAAERLDGALNHLVGSLEKHGVALSVNFLDIVGDIQGDLLRANHESEKILARLDQLQNLVHSCALITSSLQLDKVLEQVMESVIRLTGAERAYLMLRDRTTDKLTIRAARNWDNSSIPEGDAQLSRSIIESALSQATPITTTNAQQDKRFQSATSVVLQGLRSILCIPLILDGQVVGVLYADHRIKQGIFGQGDVALLTAFGTQAAIAIDKARLHEEEIRTQRLEQEINVGRRIQVSLLPKVCPTVKGWDFAATYLPARTVSGDFYDFFDLPGEPGRLGVVIADVADKGVPAAIFMALSRTMIRTTALSGCGPSEALARANDLIMKDSTSELFLTAFYSIIDTTSGGICYANGGHNRPLLLRAKTDTFEELSAHGLILGIFNGVQLEEKTSSLDGGDLLVFFTDGVTEAMNSDGDLFSDERLHTAILENRQGSADQIAQALVQAVKKFTGDIAQSDDVTLVVVKHVR